MKRFLLIAAICASAALAADSPRGHSQKIVMVVAENADPSIGVVVAPTLAAAVAEVEDLASLDPICNIQPQVCEARADSTVYYAYYSDGSVAVVEP